MSSSSILTPAVEFLPANELLPAANERNVVQPEDPCKAQAQSVVSHIPTLQSESANLPTFCSPAEAKPFDQVGTIFVRSYYMYGKPGDIVERQWTLVSDGEDTPDHNQDDSNQ